MACDKYDGQPTAQLLKSMLTFYATNHWHSNIKQYTTIIFIESFLAIGIQEYLGT